MKKGPDNWLNLLNSAAVGDQYIDVDFDTIDEMLYWSTFTDSAVVTAYDDALALG